MWTFLYSPPIKSSSDTQHETRDIHSRYFASIRRKRLCTNTPVYFFPFKERESLFCPVGHDVRGLSHLTPLPRFLTRDRDLNRAESERGQKIIKWKMESEDDRQETEKRPSSIVMSLWRLHKPNGDIPVGCCRLPDSYGNRIKVGRVDEGRLRRKWGGRPKGPQHLC